MTGKASAWVACGATATLAVARLALAIVDPESSSSASGPLVPGGGISMAPLEATVLLLLGVVGAVLTARQPRNAIGWILCATALFFRDASQLHASFQLRACG